MSDIAPARIGVYAPGVADAPHRPQPKPKAKVAKHRPPAKAPVIKPHEAREMPRVVVVAAHTRAPNVPRIQVAAHVRMAKVADAKGKAAKGGRKVAKAVAGMTAAKLGLINASGK